MHTNNYGGLVMKKLLCVLLAACAMFCFAGCEDGKCDVCEKKTENCKVYEELDNRELCPTCATKEALKEGIDNIFG